MSKFTRIDVDVDADPDTGVVGRCVVMRTTQDYEEAEILHSFELATYPDDPTKYDPNSQEKASVKKDDEKLDLFSGLIGVRVADELLGGREDTLENLALMSLIRGEVIKQPDIALVIHSVASRKGVCRFCHENVHIACLARLRRG